MKKLLLVFILIISLLSTGVFVYADDYFVKRSYDAATNTVTWENDLYTVVFTGNTASDLKYDGERLSTVVFPGPVQVQLVGSYDFAFLYKEVNGEYEYSENYFTSIDYVHDAYGKLQTNTVMLTEGKYDLSFAINYGDYGEADAIGIEIGNGSYVESPKDVPVAPQPAVPAEPVKIDTNRTSYFTSAAALPEDAKISSWAKAEVNEAFAKSIVPLSIYNEGNYQREITRKEFAYIMVGAMQSFNYTFDDLTSHFIQYGFSTEFTDTNNDLIIQIARINNIAGGTSETTFLPDGLLQREQAAAMLDRLYSQCQTQYGITKPRISSPTYFADRDKFSSWSVEGINFVSAIADRATDKLVMGGVGNDMFLPQGNITVEQALIATKRLLGFAKGKYDDIQAFINGAL